MSDLIIVSIKLQPAIPLSNVGRLACDQIIKNYQMESSLVLWNENVYQVLGFYENQKPLFSLQREGKLVLQIRGEIIPDRQKSFNQWILTEFLEMIKQSFQINRIFFIGTLQMPEYQELINAQIYQISVGQIENKFPLFNMEEYFEETGIIKSIRDNKNTELNIAVVFILNNFGLDEEDAQFLYDNFTSSYLA